jgi:hypothetical protein
MRGDRRVHGTVPAGTNCLVSSTPSPGCIIGLLECYMYDAVDRGPDSLMSTRPTLQQSRTRHHLQTDAKTQRYDALASSTLYG